MTLDEMRALIIADFSKGWLRNDRAHRETHFASVEKCGNYINDKLQLGFDPKLIMLMAYFHDMFSYMRDEHHQLSAGWVLGTTYPLIADLSIKDRRMLADACREHRASYKGEYSHTFSEMMACADRGMPGNINDMLGRALGYRLDRGYSIEVARAEAVIHLKEKFGKKGYAKYPNMYLRAFGDELDKQRDLIMSL